MILSKANLLTAIVAKDDKGISALNNIHIAKDGSSIGASSKAVIAVSPVHRDIKNDVILDETNVDEPLTIPRDVINKVLKDMPKDTLFNGLREHCDIQKKENKVLFSIKDGQGTNEKNGILYRHNYIDYKALFLRALPSERKSVKCILNIKRLRSVIDAIDKMCPDDTNENAVFIEFTGENDAILRAVNKSTQQRVIAIVWGYGGIEGKWLKETKWEKSLTEKSKRIKKKEKKKCLN